MAKPCSGGGEEAVLITGCSSGSIGAALVRAFVAQSQLRVFAAARSTNKMNDLEGLPRVTLLALDVTSPESISKAVALLRREGVRLRYLYNNAGCGYNLPYLDADVEICRAMFEVNVWGPVRMTQAFIDMLVDTQGTVVTSGSVDELVGVPFGSPYSASKAAMWNMTGCLELELHPLGVKVLHVTTANVKTNWFDNVPQFQLPESSFYRPIESQVRSWAMGDNEFTNWGDADTYASKVVRQVLSGASGRIWAGKGANYLGWMMAILPRWALKWYGVRATGLNSFQVRKGRY